MSNIHATAIVEAGAALADDVVIGPYCVIGPHARLGPGVRLHAHVVIEGHTTIGAGCTLFPFAAVGTQTQDLKYRGATTVVEVGEGTTLRECVTVNAGTTEEEITRVGANCHIMAYSHVAHGCRVGDGVIMANGTQLAGHIVVEEGAILGGLCGFHQFVRVGRYCMVGGMSRISQDCPPYMIVVGNPPEVKGPNREGLKRRGFDEQTQRRLKDAYRLLYRAGLSTAQALERVRGELLPDPHVEHLVEFVAGSRRGIVK